MHEIRWFAFIPALILAPLALAVPAFGVVALIGSLGADFNAFAIAVYAMVAAPFLGAPTYLTFGAFAFGLGLHRMGLDAPFWSIGLAANLISAPLVYLVLLAVNPDEALPLTAFVVGFGTVFAPIWGAIFGWIYRAMVRKGDALREAAHGLG